jgi:hypothetical protein
MNAIAAFFISVGSAVFGWLIKRFSLNVSFALAYVTAYIAALTTFLVTIKAGAAALYLSFPDGWLKVGFYVCWPDNAELCIGAIITSDIAKFVFVLYDRTSKAYYVAAIR